jgi:hypothetical protein
MCLENGLINYLFVALFAIFYIYFLFNSPIFLTIMMILSASLSLYVAAKYIKFKKEERQNY